MTIGFDALVGDRELAASRAAIGLAEPSLCFARHLAASSN